MKNFPERRVLSYLKGPKITLCCITYIGVFRNKRNADKPAVTIIVTSWCVVETSEMQTKRRLQSLSHPGVLSKQAKCRQNSGYNHFHILVCCRNKRNADNTAVAIIVTSWRETARNTVISYFCFETYRALDVDHVADPRKCVKLLTLGTVLI